MNKPEWRERLPILGALNIHTLHRGVEVVQREEVEIAIEDLSLPSVSLPNERLVEAIATEAALAEAGITVEVIHQKTADFLRRLERDAAKLNEERSILADRMSKAADRNEVEALRERIMRGYRTKQLSGAALGDIARQILDAPTKEEKDVLEEKLIEGFYGGKLPHPSIEELTAKITPENQHPLLPWGPARGQEVE